MHPYPSAYASLCIISYASFESAAEVWSGTPIRDTGCCYHPLTGVPCLRPGPRRTTTAPTRRLCSRMRSALLCHRFLSQLRLLQLLQLLLLQLLHALGCLLRLPCPENAAKGTAFLLCSHCLSFSKAAPSPCGLSVERYGVFPPNTLFRLKRVER